MKLLCLDHVQLAMPEGEENKARSFYQGLLGLTEVEKPENLKKRGGCWFQSGDIKIHLGVEMPFTPATKAHPAFVVSDLNKLAEIMQQAGYRVVTDEPLVGFDRLYIDDPFGNRIEFMQPAVV
ncbi:catechol 2,3-dioxygenase-like lactoylglutathione lyase family enzyme [Paenochrobactrum gallinarii]|uniref:Catechol 2,3-dioxygenase-like lactoylglutathione lyase family enzyme n=1 Tax=Paenochrobactrum gallinarii TaxID=643673 RepID=A0A841LX36_9HYPH|nr:VOC family protein [Paenochrobactrum gallinarii]MBB6261057.1 catechol 2,3-dioxygenase-like lactoylglutathione lyase family enzyme [Paenochrobactrum gallinarii]